MIRTVLNAATAGDDPATVPTEILLIGGISVVLGVTLVWFVVVVRRRHIVDGASSALQRLTLLNSTYFPLTRGQSPIRLRFDEFVDSKSKFDRFDLHSFTIRCVLEREEWVASEIEARWTPVALHDAYVAEFERLALHLGASGDDRLTPGRFAKTESRLFTRRKLPYPMPVARVRSTVRYTSPKGRNSYSKSLEWNFTNLRAGLHSGREQRDEQSTAAYLRKQERAKMTDRLRMQILRRDDFRCQMCGASRGEGAQLHVDHIRPVSRGGLTVLENLQALCRPCNMGKSNTFVG
jgi:5-methylcytosine-specific restriction endonuclease McrA